MHDGSEVDRTLAGPLANGGLSLLSPQLGSYCGDEPNGLDQLPVMHTHRQFCVSTHEVGRHINWLAHNFDLREPTLDLFPQDP